MDWIALVSVVTSAAVGVAGVWAGRVNARETRESAERTAREQHEREDRIARDTKYVGWRENLSGDLYVQLVRVGWWIAPGAPRSNRRTSTSSTSWCSASNCSGARWLASSPGRGSDIGTRFKGRKSILRAERAQ